MTNKRMEVRCCCDAGKLLGTVPGEMPKGADFVNFVTTQGQTIELPVGELWLPGLQVRRALKSMDKPIEELRTIRGWEDA